MKGVDDPNIIKLIDFIPSVGALLMEFLSGGDLQNYLTSQKRTFTLVNQIEKVYYFQNNIIRNL